MLSKNEPGDDQQNLSTTLGEPIQISNDVPRENLLRKSMKTGDLFLSIKK
mgnify:FL=1